MLERNLNLIRKITWSFVRTTGLDFDDLFQEACLACLEAQSKYDHSKGKESTFLWWAVENHLKTITSEEYSKNNTLELFDTPDAELSPEQELEAQEHWQELLSSFSPEAQLICEMALHGTEYIPVDKPKKARGQIVKSLRKQGWSWGNIWGGFREIKQALNES